MAGGVIAVRAERQCLLFDLDNTLYPERTGLIAHLDRRIGDYLAFRLGLEQEDVARLRRFYWEKYGTTLRGVKEHHGVDPAEYIAHVYDVDPGAFLRPDEGLREMLRRLPWTKVVFSNSPESYARKVLAALGIEGEFAKIYGIDFSAHKGKPDPEAYHLVLKDLDLPGPACVMIDDCAANLIPARALGMTTVYLGAGEAPGADYRVESLRELERVLL